MKRLLTAFLTFSSITLLMLSSCKKNDAIVTEKGSTSSVLTASTTTPVLDKTKIADTTSVVMFNLSLPHYTFKAVGSNSLQIDAAGDNWKNPSTTTLTTTALSQGFSTAAFDALLLKLKLPAYSASQVNVRVVNSLSTEVASYSNVVTLTVTPFNLTSYIYVVGSFQGYSLGNADSLQSSTGNGIYSGVINFGTGGNDFLILPEKTDYNNKYATTQTTTPTSISTVGAANNLLAPTGGGNYLVTLNTNTGAITFVLVNHYSVIGDAALGWNATGDDTEMKYINDGNGNWAVTLPLVSSGSFKVRQNDDWTYSWGIPKAGADGDGIANTLNDDSNNNIAITVSGNYKVTFYDPASPATTPAPTGNTTTYSVTKQ